MMGEPAIEVAGLRHRFGRTEALRRVSFDVRPGEIFGLLGPNGAGKSTTIHILLALLRPTAGLARVAGVDVAVDPEAVRRAVGWVPQERAVDGLLSARENLRFAAGLHHLPKRDGRRRADELLELVGLAGDGDRLVRDFSGGMRRRLELAMGLVHQPKVLFLDEPTLGLDIAARRMLWRHVEDVRRSGSTVMLTTHYLDEADSLCDRVAIIDRGAIEAIGPPGELKRSHGRDVLYVEADDLSTLLDKIGRHPAILGIQRSGRSAEIQVADLVAVTQAVAGSGIRLTDLWARRASLDDVFMSLTGRGLAVPS